MEKTYEFTFNKAEHAGVLSMRPQIELTVHYYHDFLKYDVSEEEIAQAKEMMLKEIE